MMTTKAIRRILVPVDLSSCSRAALEFARTLGGALDASLDVLFVSPESGSEAQREAERELRGFVAGSSGAPSVTLRERVVSGDPRERIVSIAEGEDFDLVILGTHGRTGRPRMLAGSVAESVVRTSSRPVVTVREPM
jgi:nucleotide-binding universal stress UspA family protein